MIKRILVGLSGTPFSHVAIRRAVELAQTHQAMLTGVTVVNMRQLENVGPVPIGAGDCARELRLQHITVTYEVVEKAIEEFESACRAAQVPYCIKREEGKPFDLMVSLSRYHDLMIFGLRGLFDYGYAGEPKDILAQLVRGGVRPIIAVSEHFRTIRRVLVAYSGSMESAKTMRRFVQMRLWPDVTLRIVTFEHPSEKAYQLLADAVEYCRAHGYEPESECSLASAREQLLPYAAEWEADLIVLGNSARSYLSRAVLGETALNVIRNADRPLFLAQ